MRINKLEVTIIKGKASIWGHFNGEKVRIANIQRAPNITEQVFRKTIIKMMTNLSEGFNNGFII